MARIYFILIFFWFTISFSRSIINLAKGIYELPRELSLSPHEKRVDIFGEEYKKFYKLQESSSKASKILIIAAPNMIERGLFYKSYYFLYPRKITIELISLQKNTSMYDYVLDFNQ